MFWLPNSPTLYKTIPPTSLRLLARIPSSGRHTEAVSETTMMSHSFSLITFLFISLSTYAAAARTRDTSHDLVRSSCVHASYPDLCFRTLSSYSGPAKTPRDLAQAAVKVSLSRATKVSNYLLQVASLKEGTSKKEKSALSDCVEQISDSVDELRKSLSELKHLRTKTFRWQMSNAETWVSAALTNEDTCLDGFQDVDGKTKADVKRKIRNVSKVTSNALYLINLLDASRGKSAVDP